MIAEVLQREIDVGSFPAAAWAVGSSCGIDEEGALGHAVAVPLRIPATLDTIFDVASLTKPLITATLVLQAVADGLLSLDDRFEGFTYRSLLTHTSGLTAWLPLYAFPDPLQAILERGRGTGDGGRVYSDLNFVMLWYALQRLYGDYVARANERILAPLGVDALFRPPVSLKPRIAATEWGQRWEMKMCAERKIAFDGFRQTLIWGETHDGNSHHLGGTAGNAGLFATARAVFHIAQAFVNGELVPRELIGLGWDKPTPGSLATAMLSPTAFGHTGFTGTSVWIDGDRIFVLLTNRVHPVAAANAMQRIRGEFHRLLLR
ncbi:MAG TPA: serine hydrolase domain-containing protein [Thermoanaerobaculia bacterium]|nr:serine hydrolase domain-containing protein [Thermoanaerobaculia bacterium]